MYQQGGANMDFSNIREILLSNKGTIHIDERIDSEALKGGCRVLYCNQKYFPKGIERHGYWYSNGKYDGEMYSVYYSRFSHDWWINLYPENWTDKGYFTIMSDGRLTKSKGVELYEPTNIEDIEDLILDVIKQLYSFNIRHNVNLYSKDIEQLRTYLSKYQNEILDIGLNNIKESKA